MTQPLDVFVTVGMGRFPFDRLVGALAPVAARHRVFAQTGTSCLEPPCPHAAAIPYDEFDRRLHDCDVVVTHGGNTVRQVQRLGKVPIAVARSESLGEMNNGHQRHYLAYERQAGRVVVIDDVADLGEAVDDHPAVEARLIAERAAPPPLDPQRVIDVLDRAVRSLGLPSR